MIGSKLLFETYKLRISAMEVYQIPTGFMNLPLPGNMGDSTGSASNSMMQINESLRTLGTQLCELCEATAVELLNAASKLETTDKAIGFQFLR